MILASVAAVRHRDVEMLDPLSDVGDDPGQLRLAVGALGGVGKHPHRHVVFSDPVDPAGQLIFGAERGLEKSFGDLAVGEDFLLGALARGDGGNFGRCGLRQDDAVEREAGEGDREAGAG